METYEIPSNSSNVENLGQIVGYQYMGTTIWYDFMPASFTYIMHLHPRLTLNHERKPKSLVPARLLRQSRPTSPPVQWWEKRKPEDNNLLRFLTIHPRCWTVRFATTAANARDVVFWDLFFAKPALGSAVSVEWSCCHEMLLVHSCPQNAQPPCPAQSMTAQGKGTRILELSFSCAPTWQQGQTGQRTSPCSHLWHCSYWWLGICSTQYDNP